MIETAATRAAAGFRSMSPAVLNIREKAPHLAVRLLPTLVDLRDAIETLVRAAEVERRA
ncbi:MAG TPA: hypothetical protein VI072_27785 [Polyangiaceae bacterium]